MRYDILIRRSVLPEILYAEDIGVALEIAFPQAAEGLTEGRFGRTTLIEGRLAVGRGEFLRTLLGSTAEPEDDSAVPHGPADASDDAQWRGHP